MALFVLDVTDIHRARSRIVVLYGSPRSANVRKRDENMLGWTATVAAVAVAVAAVAVVAANANANNRTLVTVIASSRESHIVAFRDKWPLVVTVVVR